jgi:GNAT superfamily N-acetyltransferase
MNPTVTRDRSDCFLLLNFILLKALHMQFITREARMDDVDAITALSNQLGYAITEAATRQNLESIREGSTDMVWVAIYEGKVAGWIHIFQTVRLESGAFFEIGGLVVAEEYRRKGIGRLLVTHAKDSCSRTTVTSLRVRCNVKRKEAHDFYRSLGFSETKEQKVFETQLSS